MVDPAGVRVRCSWRAVAIGLAVAVASVLFPPGVDRAGATVPVPPGGGCERSVNLAFCDH